MKKLLLSLSMVLFAVSFALAQKTVTGMVTDTDSEPLIGASVLVKGTSSGTVTDIDGKFSLKVPEGSNMLTVTYTGYDSQDVTVTGSTVNIILAEGVALDEVVVTALGISRDKRSLGYSTQSVDGDELTKTKTGNFVNNLSGKVSGVQIKTNNNFGGSTNVVIRGNASLNGNNQALFVVDGIPINNVNTNTTAQKGGSAGYDYGNPASDINPDDIESVNVLKGAAATALYGSRGANGVILVTTKKGAKNKGLGVSVSTSVTAGFIDKTTFIEYQDEYGAGYGAYYGETGYFDDVDVDGDGVADLVVPTYDDASYGAKFEGQNVYQWDSFVPESSNFGKAYAYEAASSTPVDFFETALTLSNSVALSGGNDKGAFRIGYTNYNTTGVMPNSEITKNTVNFSSSYELSDKLTASFNGSYLNQGAVGRNSTGYSDNLMSQFRQWWQVNVDVNSLEQLYNETGRNVTWNSVDPAGGNFSPQYLDNPYWTRYQNFQTDDRNRFIGAASLNYELTDWLGVMGRFTLDNYSDLREERRAVGSVATPFGRQRNDEQSGYQRYELDYQETNIDFILTADRDLSDQIGLKAFVGTNLRRNTQDRVLSSTSGGLKVPGLYSLSNSVNALPLPFESYWDSRVYGYFASASLDYDDLVYLDGTFRSDVSSTLPVANNVYNYGSVSAGFVFSKLINSDVINFSKLRLSYAVVGNDTDPGNVFTTYTTVDNFGATPLYSVAGTQNNLNLRPEKSASLEAGLEMNFYNSRFGFDVSVYKTNTTEQIFDVSVSRATGNNRKFLNSGEIENKGLELSINAAIVKTDNFQWRTALNYTANRNEVISLFDDGTGNPVENFQVASYQGGISINATVGQPYGSIRGSGYLLNDNGDRVVNESGYYIAAADQVIGNVNPDFLAGLSNTISYKTLSLSFLLDMQKGGDVYSLDQHYGQGTGLSAYTAGNNELGNPIRDPVADGGGVLNEGVMEDGTPNTTRVRADYFGGAFYWGNSARNPGEMTVYDASFVKLREVALTIGIPSSVFNDKVKGASFSLIGRNLWIIHKNLPFADPESGLSSGNAQGYISGAYPTVKTIGAELKFNF